SSERIQGATPVRTSCRAIPAGRRASRGRSRPHAERRDRRGRQGPRGARVRGDGRGEPRLVRRRRVRRSTDRDLTPVGIAFAAAKQAVVDQRVERFERLFQWPVIVASLLVVPTIALEASSAGQPWSTVAEVLNWTTWLVFALELVVMLAVVPRRGEWLRSHPLEVAIV